MRQTTDSTAVERELLEEVVRKILSVGSPQKIVLFGSRSRGDDRPDSDLDLLVIEESDRPRHKRAARYLRSLVGVLSARDVVVWTPAEIQEWAGVKSAFITKVLREGRTLYARPS